jgi:hypothetical protein
VIIKPGYGRNRRRLSAVTRCSTSNYCLLQLYHHFVYIHTYINMCIHNIIHTTTVAWNDVKRFIEILNPKRAAHSRPSAQQHRRFLYTIGVCYLVSIYNVHESVNVCVHVCVDTFNCCYFLRVCVCVFRSDCVYITCLPV